MDESQRKLKVMILDEIASYSDTLKKVDRLYEILERLNDNCTHEEAYINGKYSDPIECRTYYQVYCPDCEREWDEKVTTCTRQTKEEYETKLRQ